MAAIANDDSHVLLTRKIDPGLNIGGLLCENGMQREESLKTFVWASFGWPRLSCRGIGRAGIVAPDWDHGDCRLIGPFPTNQYDRNMDSIRRERLTSKLD